MAHLHVLKGGQNIPLDREKTVLGRDPGCDVVIGDSAVSRTHACILKVQGQYQIEDLKSRNFTFVNNHKVPVPGRILLKNDDRIKICNFECTFHDGLNLKPLPEELRRDQPEPEDTEAPSVIEAAVSHLSSNLRLQTQPADQLKAILDISRNLGKTLEPDTLLPKIVDSLFELYKQADRGFIILWDEASKRPRPKVIKTRRPHEEGNVRFSRSIVKQCLETVQAILSEDASQDPRFATSQSIPDFSIRSVMCAPLWSQDGKAFGVIQLDTQDRRKKFTEDDLNLLMGVAAQASIALENAKLHQEAVSQARIKRDLELARQVQRNFLPSHVPQVPGYEFFAYYEPALEVSGDYYDFFDLPQQRVGIMLGDVAGKGVAAALLMAKFSAEARSCMLTEKDPAAAVSKLNTIMHQAAADRFVTLAAVVLDPGTHTATLVNAGHPSPLILRRASGDLEEATPKEMAGLPIGVLDSGDYTSREVHLEPGDAMFIFSDGVPEAMDIHGHEFKTEGIRAAVQGCTLSPRGLGERLVKAVKQHAAGRSQHDDITLICFGRIS